MLTKMFKQKNEKKFVIFFANRKVKPYGEKEDWKNYKIRSRFVKANTPLEAYQKIKSKTKVMVEPQIHEVGFKGKFTAKTPLMTKKIYHEGEF